MHASSLADLQWELAAWDAFGDLADGPDLAACGSSDLSHMDDLVRAADASSPA